MSTEPQHISTIIGTMFRACPLCGANPMQPCRSTLQAATDKLGAALRYTHVERNR